MVLKEKKIKQERHNMFIRAILAIIVCFTIFMEAHSGDDVSYGFDKETELGKITLQKISVTLNSAGIVSVISEDKILTENINCYFTGSDWKTIWDPLRTGGKRSLELIEENSGKYFLSTQTLSSTDFPQIKVKTRISLSKSGILSVSYNFEQPDSGGTLNNCFVFIGNNFDKIVCADKNGKESEFSTLSGTVNMPKEIKIFRGDKHWTIRNEVISSWNAAVIGDMKKHITYRFKAKMVPSFSLNLDFSEFVNSGIAAVAAKTQKTNPSQVVTPGNKGRKEQCENMLKNGGFEFGMNSWISGGHTFDEWEVTETEPYSGKHCLTAKPDKEWKDGFPERDIKKVLISDLVQTGGKPLCASLWMKGAGNPKVKVSLGQISRDFDITEKWTRYFVEPNLAETEKQASTKEAALSILTVIKNGQSISIDDAGITEGALLPERIISNDYSVVPETNNIGNIFEKDKDASITVTGVNASESPKIMSVKYEI